MECARVRVFIYLRLLPVPGFEFGDSLDFSLSDNALVYHLGVNDGRVKRVNIAERIVFVINVIVK